MLKFTANQAAWVLAGRERFDQFAGELAKRYGLEATNGYADEHALHGNSIAIPLDAWRRIDGRVQQLARSRLVVFNRLAASSTIPVSIADFVNYYAQVSDSSEVMSSMDGRNTAKADAPVIKFEGTPIPIQSANTRFGWRQMEMLKKGGMALDTVALANDQRRIAEKMEDMVINGDPKTVVGGSTIYGLRTLPARNTFAHGLTLATATGAQWLAMIKQAIAAALADNNYGRLTLFVNQGDYTAADTTDYAANYAGTILSRLRTIGQIAEIVPSPSVPVNEVLGIVDMDAGTWGGILSAMPLTTRPKTRIEPEDDYVFGVMAAAAPQFRSDFNGQSAFVHGTQA